MNDKAQRPQWTAANFSADRAVQFCDVILKGGVTSGVVYPLTICRLAGQYALRSIGGTSVGAIAASATAAAEYRRRRTGSGEGYAVLSTMPDFLEREGTLRALFDADKAGRPLLAAALHFVGRAPFARKVLTFGLELATQYWWVLAICLAGSFAAFAVVGAPVDNAAWTRCMLGALVLGGLASLVSLVGWYMWRVVAVLSQGDFGLCHGFDGHRAAAFEKVAKGKCVTDIEANETPPLTDWLDALIAQVADRKREDPLTFGDLWSAPPPAWYKPPAVPPWYEPKVPEPSIDFRMVTTCLTLGRPFELPFHADPAQAPPTGDPETDTDAAGERRPPFYFSALELAKFFPTHIVQHLVAWGAASPEHRGLHRFPAAHAVPLVVAARMSMSFPILFSAVPLHSFDDRGIMRRVWFSDGGLTSNFPINLFDSPLPRWPTFAIDLLGDVQPRGKHRRGGDVNRRVFMEDEVAPGQVNPRNNLEQSKRPRENVFAFVMAIIETMRTWQDTFLGSLPGNSTRTVGIRLTEEEGGLNLNMPPDIIKGLIGLGDSAGKRLISEFASSFSAEGWKKHRVVRYQATMGAAVRWLSALERGYQPPSFATHRDTYGEMILRDVPWRTPAMAPSGLAATESLVGLQANWAQLPNGAADFTYSEPEPVAKLRMRPDY